MSWPKIWYRQGIWGKNTNSGRRFLKPSKWLELQCNVFTSKPSKNMKTWQKFHRNDWISKFVKVRFLSRKGRFWTWITKILRYHCTFFASFLISKSLRISRKQMGRNLNTSDKGHPEVSSVEKILNLFLKVWKFWPLLESPFFLGVQNR